MVLFCRRFLLADYGSCHNTEAADEQQSNPKPHHTVIAGLRRLNIIGRLVVRIGSGCTNVVFAGIALAIVISICVSNPAVLDDNATSRYGAFFPMVILVGLPIGLGVTELRKVAPICKVGNFLYAECIFVELATAFALVVCFLTALCARRFDLCNRLNVAGVSCRNGFPSSNESNVAVYCGIEIVSGAVQSPALEIIAALGRIGRLGCLLTFFDSLRCYSRATVGVKGYGINRRYNLLLFPSSNKGNVTVYCGVEIISGTVESPALEIIASLGRIGRLGSLLTCFDSLSRYPPFRRYFFNLGQLIFLSY